MFSRWGYVSKNRLEFFKLNLFLSASITFTPSGNSYPIFFAKSETVLPTKTLSLSIRLNNLAFEKKYSSTDS